MDAKWTIKQNNGSELEVQLGIRTNTSSLNLGPAAFIFTFDHTSMSFAGGSGTGTNTTDYNWQTGFGPGVSAYNSSGTKVIQPSAGTINIILDFVSGSGTAISSTSTYTPIIDLTFAISDPTGSTNLDWAMTETTPGTFDEVFDDGFNSFDEGLFSNVSISALPVDLIVYKVERYNNENLITWTTASENNNACFIIEKSQDGKLFQELSIISGIGSKATPSQYKFMDENPFAGTTYYRLVQIDYNGKKTYYPILACNKEVDNTLSIKKSFFSGNDIMIHVNSPTNTYIKIQISNMKGQVLLQKTINISDGVNNIILPANNISANGIYQVRISNNLKTIYSKILKVD